MSVTPACLENIIGLSRTSCDCFTSGMPYDAQTSKSGRYLDETEGLNLNIVDAAADCEQGNLWDMMQKARENAITSFKGDMMQKLVSTYKHKRKTYAGVMGGTDFKTNLEPKGSYAGVQIYCANIISGVMTIRRLGFLFDRAASFPVYIYDALNDSPVASYNVSVNANSLTWFNLPSELNLEMNNTGNDNPRYWILYPTGAYKPKDNKSSCGCGGAHYQYYWNVNNPVFKSYEKYRWSEFVMFTGTYGSATDVQSRINSYNTEGYLQGMVVDVEFKCKIQDLICNQSLDFESNENAVNMASAIQFKAAANLIDSILASGNINRFTMTDRERLMGKKNTYIQEYQKRLDWGALNININTTDCLVCDDFNDLLKGGIFA